MLDFIQWRAGKTPEAQALLFNGRWYSYRDLDGRANRLANRLRSLGIKAGDTVSVLALNHPIHFDLLFAAPKLGYVFAPLNPELDAGRLAADVEAIKPALLFVDSRHQSLAEGLGAPWSRLSEYREWLAAGSLNTPEPPQPPVQSGDPLLMFSTAQGTVRLPYRQVLLNARHSADAWGLSPKDATVHCLPCYGPALAQLALPMLYRGGRVALMTVFDPDEYLGHLALHRVTVAALTPPLLARLVAYRDFGEADLSSLNWMGAVGGVAAANVRKAFQSRGVELRLMLPLAAAGPNLFHSRELAAERPALLGVPLPDLRMSLVRPDGHAVAQGEAGELLVSGAMLSLAVPGNGTSAERWFATGEILREEADGQFRWLGHAAQAFECRGVRVHPGEIEQAALGLSSVAEALALDVLDEAGNTTILCALVLREGQDGDAAILAAQLAPLLPEALRPDHVVVLKQLPRDAWGEPKRDEIVDSWLQGREAAVG